MSRQSQRFNVVPTVTMLGVMKTRLVGATRGHALLKKKKSDALTVQLNDDTTTDVYIVTLRQAPASQYQDDLPRVYNHFRHGSSVRRSRFHKPRAYKRSNDHWNYDYFYLRRCVTAVVQESLMAILVWPMLCP